MLNFQFRFYPTDVLFFLIILCISLSILYIRTQPHLRAPWRRIIIQPSCVVTICGLAFFICIALLDSIHFQFINNFNLFKSSEIYSVLDIVLSPLGEVTEKTYSSPFASVQFTKEVFIDSSNHILEQYPPLEYIKNTSPFFNFMTLNIISTILKTCTIITVLFFLVYFFNKKQHKNLFYFLKLILKKTSSNKFPWRILFVTLSFLVFINIFLLSVSKSYHIFGTDQIGQDIFYVVMKSIRTSMIIGLVTTLIALPFSIFLGIWAGYYSGWIDDVIQYIYITFSSIPSVLLIAASILAAQIFLNNHPDFFINMYQKADMQLLILCLILGITSWASLCRLLRAETLKVKEMDYVQAAIALGTPSYKILYLHILPNISHIIIISIVLDFSSLVLIEAVLSYVGAGVDPLTPSFGNIINAARMEMANDPMVWWPLTSAFFFMFFLVLCANIFSDQVRRNFDPKEAKD